MKRIFSMIAVVGISMSLGWLLPAQQTGEAAKGPQWKDRAEYDIYGEYSAAKDSKGRLAALEKWEKGYADSEMWQARDEMYLAVYGEMKDARKAFDKSKAIIAKQPNNYYANYGLLSGIYSLVQGANPPPEADLAAAEKAARNFLDNTDKLFGPENKPGLVATPEAWADFVSKNKTPVTTLAQRTVAWIYVQRKDDVKAEQELTKYIQINPAEPAFSYMLGQAKFGQYQKSKNLSKVPEAIFHIARAGSFDGQGALPAATRTQYVNAANAIYKQYHGDESGFQEVLAAAKVGAMPPSGFKIESITEIQEKEMANRDAWEKEHPDLAFWDNVIRKPLTGENGTAVFESNFKDAALPPGPPTTEFTKFKATIISMTPETNPKEIVVGVFNGNTADATLTLDTPLPGKMEPGQEIQFKGTVKGFSKEPFMLNFAVDTEEKELEGWTGVAEKGKAAPKGKAAAPKGKAAAPKGKAK